MPKDSPAPKQRRDASRGTWADRSATTHDEAVRARDVSRPQRRPGDASSGPAQPRGNGGSSPDRS